MNKIYLASSWKNKHIVRMISEILRNKGFEVDDFTDDSRGRFVFHYSEIGNLEDINPIDFMSNEKVMKAYEEDKRYIDWADAVILIMPAGRSAHLEAGYAVGTGKKLIVFYPLGAPKGEFDVMYGLADLMTENLKDVVAYLQRE